MLTNQAPMISIKGGTDTVFILSLAPGSRGALELVQTEGPSFSLYAALLESSGPGFRGVEQRLGEQAEGQRYTRLEMSERT